MSSTIPPTDGKSTEQSYGGSGEGEKHTWEIEDGIVWIKPKKPIDPEEEVREERKRHERNYDLYQLLQIGDESLIH